MTQQQLEQLEISALALRKIADTFLDQVRAAKKPLPPRSKKKTQIDREADVMARVLGGRKKPATVRKSK